MPQPKPDPEQILKLYKAIMGWISKQTGGSTSPAQLKRLPQAEPYITKGTSGWADSPTNPEGKMIPIQVRVDEKSLALSNDVRPGTHWRAPIDQYPGFFDDAGPVHINKNFITDKEKIYKYLMEELAPTHPGLGYLRKPPELPE